jgi:hypothetical protein
MASEFKNAKLDVGVKIAGTNMVEIDIDYLKDLDITATITTTDFGVNINAVDLKKDEKVSYFIPYSKIRYLARQ